MQNIIKQIINEPIVDIKCCSRLLHKNVVYHVFTVNNEYAVKFFYGGTDKKDRFENEMLMYDFFKKSNIINISQILDIKDSIYGKIIIMNWIKGQSLKSKLKEYGLNNCYDDISNLLTDLESIWTIGDPKLKGKLPIDKLGISNRFNVPETQVFNTIITNKPNIDFSEIIEIYNDLKNKITLEQCCVINSDISAHEYLLTDLKSYWIDFEKFKIGNPNNDLARAFQSLTNAIYKNTDEFYRIFLVFRSNKYYNKKMFFYYLTEKLFSTIYTANDQIDDNEIEFYIRFIKNNYYKSYSNLKIKKHNYFK